MKTKVLSLAAALVTLVIATPAQAGFHLWSLTEVYSDSSGSLQFIEMFDSFGGQPFTSGQQIQVTDGVTTHSFTVPSDLVGSTFGRALLFGTAGIQAAGAPAPDFIIPNNFLFTGGGTINFFGLGSGPYTALPTDGSLSR